MSPDSRREARAPIRFAKMEGAGNDFIVINAAGQELRREPGELAKAMCARRTSVGGDGLILVGPSGRGDADVRFRFWNPDGGEIDTCGNGTRCAARFAFAEGLTGEEMRIETSAGIIRARVSDDDVTLRYSLQPEYKLDIAVTDSESLRRGHYFDIGNQHFIIPLDQLPAGAIEPLCRPLRYAPELAPAGANVSLVEVIGRHRVRIRTYERGVEAETLACGSASMSSAAVLCAAGLLDPPVEVETRSGDVLTVRFERCPDGSFRDMELEGPARFVYRGVYGDESAGD